MPTRSTSQSDGELLSSDLDSETKATRPKSHYKDSHVNRHSRHHSSYSRRSRSRSRSPFRADRGEKRRRDAYSNISKHDSRSFSVRYEDDRESERRAKKSRTHSPARDRSRSPYRRDKAKTDNVMPKAKSTQSVSTQERKSDGVPPSEVDAKTEKQSELTSATTVETQSAEIKAEPILDEAAIIEARRKRREAIKNQHKTQPTSLLVQALRVDTPADSPTASTTRSVSPVGDLTSAPATPAQHRVSAPQSPITNIAKDDNFADSDMVASPRAGDEPSAADYDPTADMQDERKRHDSRLFKEDEVSSDRIAQQAHEQSAAQAEPVKSKTDEFDMFADNDDDDDMFADQSDLKSKAEPSTTAAKTLDVSMLDNWDDVEGYYLTNLREKIDDRYEVTANLGRGMFASVVRANDTKSKDNRPVAIKIIRNNESMRKAGVKEVEILRDLAANDPDDRKHVVRLLRSFDHKGHLCMVFENMDMNLREVLKKFGRDIGLNLKAIRAYAQQLFLGLSLLRKCNYLHADLKPDNILADESRTKIKIADLGSASSITSNATAPYLVSRFYRAPEVILGIEYDYGIDMWSTGCTLFELYTGKILFTGKTNNGMLKAIMECRGKFPHKILRKGSLTYEHFDDLLNFKSQEKDKVTNRDITKIIDIKAKAVRDLKSRLIPKDKRIGDQERKELEQFADLLDKCLDLRPDKRITPTEALKHPFLIRSK